MQGSWTKAAYVPVGHFYLGAPEQLEKKAALDAIAPMLSDEKISKANRSIFMGI